MIRPSDNYFYASSGWRLGGGLNCTANDGRRGHFGASGSILSDEEMDNKYSTLTIYLLELEGPKDTKYYVGKTSRPIKERWQEHVSGQGSFWTTLYPPKKMKILKEHADDFDEDKFVKMTMLNYGIDNVRGGCYVTATLTDADRRQLVKELYSVSGRCFNCGQAGHYASNCNNEKKTAYYTQTSKSLKVRKCSICRHGGHDKRSCPVRTTIR